MSCEIIQFSAAARPARPVSDQPALTPWQRRREGKPELPPRQPRPPRMPASGPHVARRGGLPSGWQITGTRALNGAMSCGPLKDTGSPTALHSHRLRMKTGSGWSTRGAKRLLTPAPTLADVAWKRAKIKSDEFNQLPITLARAEQAIADDLAFLAAHPTRRGIDSEAMARRREFNEAMRQRIREIAASRDLSDEEIRPVLSRLKHQRVAEFVDKHGVNFKWLYEGMGSIFKTGPKLIEVGNPATAVTTLPMADQQMINAMVDEIFQEHDQ
jgi:hypothetical protein